MNFELQISDILARNIPVYEVEKQGEIADSASDNNQDAINRALQLESPYSRMNIGSENFDLVAHIATRPHIPVNKHTNSLVEHVVLWWVKKDNDIGTLQPWTDADFQELVKDEATLQQFEQFISWLRSRFKMPNIQCYAVLGSLASHPRLHFHAVNPPDSIEPYRFLDVNEPGDLEQIGCFTGIAGEAAINNYGWLFASLFNRFSYKQKIRFGKNQESTLSRTMFGYNSPAQAMQAIASWDAAVQADGRWQQYAEETNRMKVTCQGKLIPIKQFPEKPAYAIIFPTEKDRERGQVRKKYKVWVIPFGTLGLTQILNPNGACFELAKPK